MEDAGTYTEPYRLERLIKSQSGHVPVPIALVDKPAAEPRSVADGTALWVRPKAEIKPEEYTDFYRSIAGQYDEPARAFPRRGPPRIQCARLRPRHAAVRPVRPGPQGAHEALRAPRLHHRRRRPPAPLPASSAAFSDSADLPLNVSRQMIQESPLLAAIRKGVTGRVLGDLAKLADNDAEAYAKIWENFGVVLKEGIYEDFERREQLLKLARFRSTASGEGLRSLADYVAAMKEGQKAIFFMAGYDRARLEASPQLEGFRARGVEGALLTDPVDSFWVTMAPDFDGKPFKLVTQGTVDLSDTPHSPTASRSPTRRPRRRSPPSSPSSGRRSAMPSPT